MKIFERLQITFNFTKTEVFTFFRKEILQNNKEIVNYIP